jgi:hypothetical protein
MDILGLESVGFGGVLLSTSLNAFFFLDLHHLLNVHVQLANKMGLKKNLMELKYYFELRHVSLIFPIIRLPYDIRPFAPEVRQSSFLAENNDHL